MKQKIKILGLTNQEIKDVVANVGLPPYAANQIADWMYHKRVKSFSEMSNIPLSKRNLLEDFYEIGVYAPENNVVSSDGTVKYLFKTTPDHFVESVLIPDKDRLTLCVSSQIGCKMNCLFCMTGKQGFHGNLTSSQILNQIQTISEKKQLTNIVFMGMGEPLDNYSELFKVLEILTAPYGYGWSPKRITVSSVGILSFLKRLLDETACNLAISLHSPYSEERQSLMPIEKKYPINDVIQLLTHYDFSHQRRLSFEYILFDNLNDSVQHARDTAKLLRNIHCRVNLIKYHELPQSSYRSCSLKKMEQFRDVLNSLGIVCTIRTSRGEDIAAACGMLSKTKSASLDQN